HDLHAIAAKSFVALSLAETVADHVEQPLLAVWQAQAEGNIHAEQLVKGDVGLIERQQVQLEGKDARDRLLAGKSCQEENICSQWRLHGQRAFGLGIGRCRHRLSSPMLPSINGLAEPADSSSHRDRTGINSAAPN